MNEVTFSHEETFKSPCVKGWDKGILGRGNKTQNPRNGKQLSTFYSSEVVVQGERTRCEWEGVFILRRALRMRKGFAFYF